MKLLLEKCIIILFASFLTYFFSVRLIDKMNLECDYTQLIQSYTISSSSLTTSLSDIVGHHTAKKLLLTRIINPIINKHAFDKHSLLVPPNGIIFHGPPGTGKTMLAKAVCKTLNCTFINFSPSMVENKLFGESGKIVEELFRFASSHTPCVIFFDEIDGFFSSRNPLDQSCVTSLKTDMLRHMDGIVEKDPSIIFIGATNKLQSLDKALLRRMKTHINIPLPDYNERIQLFSHFLKTDLDFSKISSSTDGYSGSDIHELCKDIAYASFDGSSLCITQSSLDSVKPS